MSIYLQILRRHATGHVRFQVLRGDRKRRGAQMSEDTPDATSVSGVSELVHTGSLEPTVTFSGIPRARPGVAR